MVHKSKIYQNLTIRAVLSDFFLLGYLSIQKPKKSLISRFRSEKRYKNTFLINPKYASENQKTYAGNHRTKNKN